MEAVVNRLQTLPEPLPAPVVMAVNHASASVETVTSRNVRRLSPGLVALAAVALLAVVTVTWLAKRHAATPENAATAVNTSANASSPPVTMPAALATVYLKLERGANVVLNGQPVDVKTGNNGFAALNLAAGQYRIEVHSGTSARSRW